MSVCLTMDGNFVIDSAFASHSRFWNLRKSSTQKSRFVSFHVNGFISSKKEKNCAAIPCVNTKGQ
jgi:hypothetical protein